MRPDVDPTQEPTLVRTQELQAIDKGRVFGKKAARGRSRLRNAIRSRCILIHVNILRGVHAAHSIGRVRQENFTASPVLFHLFRAPDEWSRPREIAGLWSAYDPNVTACGDYDGW